MVAITNLMASGVHLILFTTGRGTLLGTGVPTVKIATNNEVYKNKPNWMYFDASPVLLGNPMTDELIKFVIDIVNGKQTLNEKNGYEEISIFKDGATL